MKVENGKLIVAEGEATGHAHRIDADLVELQDDDSFKMLADGEIQHEEHGAINIPTGDWCSGICREQDHFAEEARRVAD